MVTRPPREVISSLICQGKTNGSKKYNHGRISVDNQFNEGSIGSYGDKFKHGKIMDGNKSSQGWMSKNDSKEIDRISKSQCSDGQGVSPRKQGGQNPEGIHQYANVITESKTNSYQ